MAAFAGGARYAGAVGAAVNSPPAAQRPPGLWPKRGRLVRSTARCGKTLLCLFYSQPGVRHGNYRAGSPKNFFDLFLVFRLKFKLFLAIIRRNSGSLWVQAGAAIDNAPTVYFELADADTTSANGGTVATSGTDRVDNFTVTASPIAVPEPSASLLALCAVAGLVGLSSWSAKSRTKQARFLA